MLAADVTDFKQVVETIGLLIDTGFRKFWWILWISIFRPTLTDTQVLLVDVLDL